MMLLVPTGLLIAAVSFCFGLLIVMAAANHPTGGSSAGLGLCATGIVAGLLMAVAGGVIHLIG